MNYVSFPLLAQELDEHTNYNESLTRLKKHKKDVEACDGVVLGCTHYNVIKDVLSKELTKYNFNGVVLDSNEILINYITKK